MAKKIFAVVVIGCALAIIKVLPTSKSTRHEPRPEGVNSAEAADKVPGSSQDRNVESKAIPSIDSKSVDGGKSVVSAPGGAKSVSLTKSVERWNLIIKQNGLPLISPDSLHLTEAAVALMELPPEQAQSVNQAIDRFLDRLRAEEIVHSYVSVDPSGKEQIVVRSFDRTEMIAGFRNELRSAGGSDVAQILGDRATSNSRLAAGNWEMRAYIERTGDGEDKEVFVCTLKTQGGTVRGVDLPPYASRISKGSLGSETRIRHLFAAMNQLPRVVENPSLPKSARASNPGK